MSKPTAPLLPLRDIIVFPHQVVPLFVGREKSIAALEEAMAGSKEILLAAQKKAKTNEPSPEDIFEVGTLEVDQSPGWRPGQRHRSELWASECTEIGDPSLRSRRRAQDWASDGTSGRP